MSGPIFMLKAGTVVIDMKPRGLGFRIETSHPDEGHKIIDVVADTQAPHGINVQITQIAPEAAVEISVGR